MSRGRGRGRGAAISFNVETLGFGRGEALPTASVEPRPTYPALEYKPVPLSECDEQKYLLALKQELRQAFRDSPYFIKTTEKKKESERYSDKYQANGNESSDLKIDWTRFPTELKIRTKRKIKPAKPRVVKSRKLSGGDINVLEAMEQKEAEEDESEEEGEAKEGRKKGDNEEDEQEKSSEEELEEEELEDDTDYNMTYFDNGENYGADEDDDLDEGATY